MGWYITDKIVEPRLQGVKVEPADGEELPTMEDVSAKESRAFWFATLGMMGFLGLLVLWAFPGDSPLRDPDGELTTFAAPLMRSIVPIIFLVTAVPGINLWLCCRGVYVQQRYDFNDDQGHAEYGLLYGYGGFSVRCLSMLSVSRISAS